MKNVQNLLNHISLRTACCVFDQGSELTGQDHVYSTSTRPGEGAIYRYLSRQGKIAGDIHETKSSGLSLS